MKNTFYNFYRFIISTKFRIFSLFLPKNYLFFQNIQINKLKFIMPFYAVARGKKPGIYFNWDICKAQVEGFANARYKKFMTEAEAQTFIDENKNLPSNSKRKANFSTYSHQKSNKIPKNDNISENEVKRKDGFIFEGDFVVIYTDGACSSNGRKGSKAGLGVWFGDDNPLNLSLPVVGRQTNNVAEIQASEKAILQAKEKGFKKVMIKTDSQFLIKCITQWLPAWKKKGWKLGNGGDVKNRVDLEKLEAAMAGVTVKWVYVAGHAGHKGNEEADRLAVEGAKMA